MCRGNPEGTNHCLHDYEHTPIDPPASFVRNHGRFMWTVTRKMCCWCGEVFNPNGGVGE